MQTILDKIRSRIKDIRIIILDFAIVAMIIVTAVFLVKCVREYADSYGGFTSPENMFVFYLDNKDYVEIVEMYRYNNAYRKGNVSDLQEYYAIAKYYEAAFLCRIEDHCGSAERVAELQETMQTEAEKMGELAFHKDWMDEKLGTIE